MAGGWRNGFALSLSLAAFGEYRPSDHFSSELFTDHSIFGQQIPNTFTAAHANSAVPAMLPAFAERAVSRSAHELFGSSTIFVEQHKLLISACT